VSVDEVVVVTPKLDEQTTEKQKTGIFYYFGTTNPWYNREKRGGMVAWFQRRLHVPRVFLLRESFSFFDVCLLKILFKNDFPKDFPCSPYEVSYST
jgi:hypothetical protein